MIVEPGIALRDEHDCGGIAILCFLEGVLDPSDVGIAAVRPLGRIRCDFAQVIAGALDVHGGVGNTAHSPAAIFNTGHQAPIRAETLWPFLHFLTELLLTESKWSAEEDLALVVEPFQRVEGPI